MLYLTICGYYRNIYIKITLALTCCCSSLYQSDIGLVIIVSHYIMNTKHGVDIVRGNLVLGPILDNVHFTLYKLHISHRMKSWL